MLRRRNGLQGAARYDSEDFKRRPNNVNYGVIRLSFCLTKIGATSLRRRTRASVIMVSPVFHFTATYVLMGRRRLYRLFQVHQGAVVDHVSFIRNLVRIF